MGWVATLKSFTRTIIGSANVSAVKVDTGGSDLTTPQHFSAPGDDSFPLEDDYVALVSQQGTGRKSAVGYIDPLNTPKATKGDKRIYARDPDSGEVVVEIWLKSDGSGTLSNDSGSVTLSSIGGIKGQNSNGVFELQDGGDFVVNGVTIASDGTVDIPASLTLNGKEIAEHNHSQGNDSDGNTEQDTGPNN